MKRKRADDDFFPIENLHSNILIEITKFLHPVEKQLWSLTNRHFYKNVPSDDNESIQDILEFAAAYGYLNIIDWIKKNRFIIYNIDEACNNATKNGHLHVLKWFKKNGYGFNSSLIESAMKTLGPNVVLY